MMDEQHYHQQVQQQYDQSSQKLLKHQRRLQMIANYSLFHPQTMACSDPIVLQSSSSSSYYNNNYKNHQSNDSNIIKNNNVTQQQVRSSLGAIAGSDGIIIFRWNEPHIPLVVLNHTSSVNRSSYSTSNNNIVASGTMTTTIPSNLRRTTIVPSSSTTSIPDTSSLTLSSSLLPSVNTESLGFTSLAFSPVVESSSSTLYLASTRGSGILVWDVSGHSLYPLYGRYGMTPSTRPTNINTSNKNSTNNLNYSPAVSTITSMKWIGLHGTNNRYIAATTSTVAGIWDLRVPQFISSSDTNMTSSSIQQQRPCIRFAEANVHHFDHSPYRQIACSSGNNTDTTKNEYECAILNMNGIVRIYDIRFTSTCTSNGTSTVPIVGDRPLHYFEACHYAGIGLDYMPLQNNVNGIRNGWVTWGFDAPDSDAVVKVWMVNEELSIGINKEEDTVYRLVGQCITPNLACARVCPSPVTNSIVTVAFNEPMDGLESSWKTDVWSVQLHRTPSSSISTSDNEQSTGYGFSSYASLDHVTTFVGPNDKTTTDLESVLGKSHLGSLRGADVTLSSYSDDKYGVLLCCLTENGFITTHPIPELLGEQHLQTNIPYVKEAKINNGIATATGSSTKLFPNNSESSIADAASAWGKAIDNTTSDVPLINRTAFLERSIAISKGIVSTSHSDETPLSYDTDQLITYSSTGYSGNSPILHATNTDNIDDNYQRDSSALTRNATVFMAKLDTSRIPSPRLCGATFSSGVGGIAVFNNGGVKRMWNWWNKSDPTRTPLIENPSLQDTFVQQTSSHFDIRNENRAWNELNSPRTLKDLSSMTQAAKEAQWGNQMESEASLTEFPVLGNEFFDDDDDDDSNASSDSGEDGLVQSTVKIDEFTHSQDKRVLGHNESTVRSNEATTSAASDMLTPFVKVSNEYNNLSLNNQSLELALGWKLGDFDVDLSKALVKCGETPMSTRFTSHVNALYETPNTALNQVLPSYRSLLPLTVGRKSETQRSNKVVEYESVHGGEYSVRPNMKESLVFLRKLFTQQHHQDGKTPFPNLLSPPDDPMLPNKASLFRKPFASPPTGVARGHFTSISSHNKNDSDVVGVGVYTITADMSSDNHEQLEKIEEVCLHNARVCESVGETTKMGSWTLISNLVQSKKKRPGRGFDGWGDALGINLVSSLMRFYESLGDVQMLSSLVCVLRMLYQYTSDGKLEWMLLPTDQDAKYDRYIRCYSALLYGWGLLTKRAELMKHLTTSANYYYYGGEGQDDSGVAFDIECTRCAGYSHFGYCQSCNDYSFRCSICDNAVRGLFTVCILCGHGGHVSHIMDWLEHSNVCPTGCGCKCKLTDRFRNNSKPLQEDVK